MINKKIWDEIILYLLSKEIINDLSYNLWIKDLSVSFKENVITIKFPSSLSKEKFISSFADIIKKTFYEFNQTNVEFKYIVSEKTKENSEKIIDKKENETQQASSKASNKEDKTLKSDLFRYDQLQYLNPRYTFDNFVIGKNNQFCAAAALRVAQAPGQHMNPLFIYGGVGLGKTHILQAIANHILINNKNLKIIYMHVEQFIDEFIYSLKNEQINSFRMKFRNADVLLLDDVQYLEQKEASMEMFFHTFNALHQAQKQMVFTCDKPPKDLKDFEERIRNRMEWGLTVQITPPDYETRIAILQKMCEWEKRTIDEKILHFIAKNVKSSIRELESALIKLIAYCDIYKIELASLSLELSKDILKDQFKYIEETRIIQIDDIIRKVAETFKVSSYDIKSKKRNASISRARNIAMYLCRELTSASTTEIGLSFGGKDHTTIIHACKKINDCMKEDELLRSTIESIVKDLSS
jgi:chromosomal replication initiator protein